MNCPNCSEEMRCTHRSSDGDMLYACKHCDLLASLTASPTPAGGTSWLEDRIVDLEQQLEAERSCRIEAERECERLRSPAAVLAEAERLLRQANVIDVSFRTDMVAVNQLVRGDIRFADCGTLAETYEKLAKKE